MKIILATSNQDKVNEIRGILKGHDIYAQSEILGKFEIIEDGTSFAQNALIKAKTVYEKLCEKGLENEFISLSDDSGISVDALGGKPGIYSARFSGAEATDASNRAKLKTELNALNLHESKAFYTACIAMASKFGCYTTHGFMHGVAIDQERGDNGFGYDFMFIPQGFNKTVGELSPSIKEKISHRYKALQLAKVVLDFLSQKF
ncbi:MAG: non-canonical purine NTP pyrophosphatase [Campylobacter sp.]|nr:non-canonical purine NTP pyrophosphatase [Campylobacter sp.]